MPPTLLPLRPCVWVLQAAAAYIEEHNLQKVVEDAINATIKAKPAEPFAFMVRRHSAGRALLTSPGVSPSSDRPGGGPRGCALPASLRRPR